LGPAKFNVRKNSQIINNDIVTAILLVVYFMAAVMCMELLNNKGEVLGFNVKARMGLWLETSKHKSVAWTWRRFLVILQKFS
jgi:hypothetical protein